MGSHSHDSLRAGCGCPHCTGDEAIPRGLGMVSKATPPRKSRAPSGSRGQSALGPPGPLLLRAALQVTTSQDSLSSWRMPDTWGWGQTASIPPSAFVGGITLLWREGPSAESQNVRPSPSVTSEGPIHSSAPLLPSGKHLAIPVWSDCYPRLSPAGEPALPPREPTLPALREA